MVMSIFGNTLANVDRHHFGLSLDIVPGEVPSAQGQLMKECEFDEVMCIREHHKPSSNDSAICTLQSHRIGLLQPTKGFQFDEVEQIHETAQGCSFTKATIFFSRPPDEKRSSFTDLHSWRS
jgi:hypothetical protein